MRLYLPTLAALVAAGLVVSSSPSFAADFSPFSVLVAKAQKSPDATPAVPLLSCETRFFDRKLNPNEGLACYGPKAIRAAYGLTRLIKEGHDGTDRTIVILDAFGSPTALDDLKTFSAHFGLPDPSSRFKVVTMPGTPDFDETNGEHVTWAQEVSLDVQWAHAIAPGANIVLVAAKSNSDADLLAGLNYAIDKRLGDVISMSFGMSEAFLDNPVGQDMIRNWEKAFTRAQKRRITIFAAAGDHGSTNPADEAGNVFPFQNVNYPASSPQVTAVGGTNLFFGKFVGKNAQANPDGKYLGEKVWNDQSQDIDKAGGGGVSTIFSRPPYQDQLPSSARRSLGKRRGLPDVAYNAGLVGGVVVYLSVPGGPPPGFYIFSGTSAGSAQWAGLVADVNEALGRRMGFLNNRLYRLGQNGLRDNDHGWNDQDDRDTLFHDIKVGDNGFCSFTTPAGEFACVPGFSAKPGWDLATGWGTPNFRALVSLFNQRDDDDNNDDDRYDDNHYDDNHRDDNHHNH